MSPDLPSPAAPLTAAAPSSPSAAGLARAYEALHHGAVSLDRSVRSRGRFSGAKAAETLTGLVTNDVVSLRPGEGQYAVALTAKGKIIADVRIFARSDDLLVDVAEAAAAGWWAMIRKFVNPRLAKYADISAETCDAGVFGPQAHELVAAVLGLEPETLATLPLYAHREATFGEDRVMVARVPDLGVQGFDIIAPLGVRESLAKALRERGVQAAPAELETLARIEAGRPAWGIDMNDGTLAQEANMEELGAISFTKGCYTGQETVARVHFRGHVNRHLRGLRFDAGRAPARLAELVDADGRTVGEVRSVATSPSTGGVALAMLRREVAPGARLTARWSEGETPVEVASLPFARDSRESADRTPPTEDGRG